MDKIPKSERMLRRVQKGLNLESSLILSQKGTPHLVVDLYGTKYSVCYFGRDRKFRVFWPYPSYGYIQDRCDIKIYKGVIQFFNGKVLDEVSKMQEADKGKHRG